MIIDLVKVIQVQRHDFMNHLQVISGLIQLSKIDRVREYINEICLDMQLMSTVNRVKIPEIAAALMIGYNLAFEKQIDISYRLNDELGETVLPGEILGNMLVEMQKVLFDFVVSLSEEVPVTLIIEKDQAEYFCRLRINTFLEEDKSIVVDGDIFKELLVSAKDKLGLDKGRVEITNVEGILELALIFQPLLYTALG